MTTRHGISHADKLYAGDAYYEKYAKDHDGRRGLELSHLYTVKLGAVDAADPNGAGEALTATAAGSLTFTATEALVSDGVVTFDVPRAFSLTSTANNSGVTFTLTGTDDYGETLVETRAGPNATTVNGAKAFKTLTAASVSGAITGNVDIGSSNVLGLPVRIAGKDDVLGCFVDGVPETTLTVVAGLTATQTSTATTGDVRGTVTPNTAPNGTKKFTVAVNVDDHGSKATAFGVAQYGG